MWVSLIEKAYAKFLGGYQAFDKPASVATAILDLTGEPCEVIKYVWRKNYDFIFFVVPDKCVTFE